MRTAAAQLEFTVHLPRLDAGPFTCLGWTPSHALINTGAPITSCSRCAGRLTRGQGLRPARWTRLFGNLAHASARLGWGRGVPPPRETVMLGHDYRSGDGLRPACGFLAAPPGITPSAWGRSFVMGDG